jgi:O-antigen/teichoic acid export membrane protein
MSRSRALFLASSAGVAQRLAQLLSSLITLPLALHALGVAGFGVWGAATSLLWLTGLLSLGLGSALITLLPASLNGGDSATARAHVGAALYGGAALAALLLLGGAAAVLCGGHPPALPFVVAAVALVLNIPLSSGGEIWFALQRGHVAALWGTVQTLLSLAGVVLGAALGWGVTPLVTVFYAALLLANGGCLAHALLVHHTLRPLARVPGTALRAVFAQGGLLSLVTAAGASAWVFDNIMALAWLGPAASAQMAVALRVCATATGLVAVVTQPFWPGFADALAAHDHVWVSRALRHGVAAMLGLSLSGSALLVAFGGPVLRFWLHQDLHIAAPLLWTMAAWIVLFTLSSVPGALLNAARCLRPQIAVLGLAALAGFALKYAAARTFGVAGILAVLPLLWLVAVAPAYLWLAARVVKRL